MRTAVDESLMERTGLDELTLRRLRKSFLSRFSRLSSKEKAALMDGTTASRLQFMVGVMHDSLPQRYWLQWLHYLEHTDRDIKEMCEGEYPVSPYLMRVFSALFGISIEFLLLGSAPRVYRPGTSIDILPLTSIR